MILDSGEIYSPIEYREIEQIQSVTFNFAIEKWETLVVYQYKNELYQIVLKDDFLYQTFQYKVGYKFKIPNMIAVGLEEFQ